MQITPHGYIHNSKLALHHAWAVLGIDATDNDVKFELLKIKKLKRNLKNWARERIHQHQFETAIIQNLDIQSWSDVGNQFKIDDSLEMCKKRFFYNVWVL